MFLDKLPTRVRVLVLGGGVHGVGVLHDLASRGWKDIHLIDKGMVGSATSSRSTKLIHGGLRYLKRITDYSLVSEALHERHILQKLAPDLINPLEFLFPILKKKGLPRWQVKIGLSLYDVLAGRYNIRRHRLVKNPEMTSRVKILDANNVVSCYSFWDCQTDDLGLVYRVASSAKKLGAGITENITVVGIRATDNGWKVIVKDSQGVSAEISALYLVNAMGPWANQVLEESGIPPTHRAINNKGSHLVLGDLGLNCGLFLQSFEGDDRIFFMVPWYGKTLLGTTESLYSQSLDDVAIGQDEVDYLLKNINHFLSRKIDYKDIESTFSGLRWLPVEKGMNISQTSRSHVIGEIPCRRGLMLTVYGGKLTTYRTLSQEVADTILKHFGDQTKSQTEKSDFWVLPEESINPPKIQERFRIFEINTFPKDKVN